MSVNMAVERPARMLKENFAVLLHAVGVVFINT